MKMRALEFWHDKYIYGVWNKGTVETKGIQVFVVIVRYQKVIGNLLHDSGQISSMQDI